MSSLSALLIHHTITLLLAVMSGSSSDQESIECLGVIPSSEPSSSPVKLEQCDARHSSPSSEYAEEFLQMPRLPLSAVAAANATQGADECTNKEIPTYLPSDSSNFLDNDGEHDMTPPSSGKHSQPSLSAEDGDARCNLESGFARDEFLGDNVDDDCGDDVDEDDDCDAVVAGTGNTTLKQKIGMLLHTVEVDMPSAPESSAPDDEIVETALAYGAFDAEKFRRMCDSNSGDYDVEFATHLDDVEREIFREGTLWLSRKVFTSVVEAIAKRQGWVHKKDNVYVKCNQFGNRKSTKRKIEGGHLDVGCTY